MLIQFNFKNFKSFREETSFDLSATKETDMPDHIRKEAHESILPVSVIYGANASGKSNVQEALAYMQSMVLYSLNYGEESKEDQYLRPTPFLFRSDSINEESSFEVYFTYQEKTFQYGFSLDDEGVVEEWLNYRAATGRKYNRIFYRSKNELNLIGIPAKQRGYLKLSLNVKTLLVSLGAKLQVEKLKIPFVFFASLEIADFGVPAKNYDISTRVPKGLVEDENVRKDVVKFFSSFDESIVDLRAQEQKSGNEGKQIRIEAGHRIKGSNEITYLPLSKESAGTLKMFSLYPYIKEVMDKGGVLFVDELCARLHPLLVRVILQAFINPENNKNNAQLVFTSHDVWQLNSGILRRDEIWFAEKSKDGESELYSLAEFTDENGNLVRNVENYEKNYLLGKYGGVPTMKAFDVFREVNTDEK